MSIEDRWFTDPLRLALRHHFALEICITDFCNLSCRYCCQSTKDNNNKKHMSLIQLRNIAELIKPHEFFLIKISGGEPTLHPEFKSICLKLREWFVSHYYQLATNGCDLLTHKKYIDTFDSIDLTLYPGLNDKIFEKIISQPFHSVVINQSIKADDYLMRNVFKKMNLNVTDIFMKCRYPAWKKIVQDRIYPCSNIFGQSIRYNFDHRSISAFMDKEWRESLYRIDIENYCRNCWVTVRSTPENYRFF
ncbi:MAG: radical SAM protein [Desulfobacterales bacterium]|nr:radical SAM protein [Desulfobacterales bacterium]